MISRNLVGCCVLLLALSASATPAQSSSFLLNEDKAAWTGFLSSGYDTYVQTYPLAFTDTTTTISDYSIAGGLNGRSARNARHGWYWRSELSAGNELFRELIDGEYQYRPDGRNSRARLRASWLGRQYRQDSQYGLTSDMSEARAEARWSPTTGTTIRSELQLQVNRIRYTVPSILELDHDVRALRFRIRPPRLATRRWEIGLRAAERAYPDSSRIDRWTYSANGDCSFGDSDRTGLMIHQRSDRRLVADSSVRPDAWTHWTDVYGSAPAGVGRMVLELQSEMWRYDQEQSVYFDSWRCDGYLSYRWGDILSALWQLGLTIENFAAGENPEAYTQAGLRGGVETFGAQFSGSLTLEYGYRGYDQTANADGLTDAGDISEIIDYSDYMVTYSDFHYVEIWLMGSWQATEHLALEVMANYQPESHTEQMDDSSVAFGSLRLIWRP